MGQDYGIAKGRFIQRLITMLDFQIWLIASIILNIAGCVITYIKNTFSVEIFNFMAFVAAIAYIILKRYTDGQWAAIPLIWLAGMTVAAVLLLMAEGRHQQHVDQTK
jgi:hypothetical protein